MQAAIRSAEDRSTVDARLPLNPQRGTAGRERLSVYASGYLIRYREALQEVYEAVHHVVGERTFAQIARAYAASYPSHDYNLSLVGRHLPHFLITHTIRQQLPFLPDLATLEWAVAEAFHATEQPALTLTRWQALSLEQWEHGHLHLHPAIRLVRSRWPILDLWAARTQDRSSISIELINRPQCVLVSRPNLQVRCAVLEAPQEALLQSLLAGRSLGEACDDLTRQFSNQELPLTLWFAHWLQQGLFTELTLAT